MSYALKVHQTETGADRAKAWLLRPGKMQQEIELQCAQLDMLRAEAQRVTGALGGPKVLGGGHGSRVERYAVALADGEAALLSALAQLETVKAQVTRAIEGMPSVQLRTVLTLRYVCLMGWEEVAERMDCSVRWVHRLHLRALDALAPMSC